MWNRLSFAVASAVAVGVAVGGAALAAHGDLDPSFGGDGDVLIPMSVSRNERGFDSLVQPDGKIVVVGEAASTGLDTNMAVVRLNKSGSADASFGLGQPTSVVLGGVSIGTAADREAAFAVALQPDGKILVGGMTTLGGHQVGRIVRLTKNGAVDVWFGGGDGAVDLDPGVAAVVVDIAALPDGKLLVLALAQASTPSELIVARYTKDGVLDTTYGGGDGMTVLTNVIVAELARFDVDQLGRAVIATAFWTLGSSEGRVLRLNTKGSLDRTFGGGDGTMTLAPPSNKYLYPTAVRVQPDGRILVVAASGPLVVPNGGSPSIGVYVARVTARGTMDPTMSAGNGWSALAFPFDTIPWDVQMQPDGRIIVLAATTGLGSATAVMRFKTNGDTDASFGGGAGSVSVSQAYGISGSLQPDGGIISTGYRDNGSDDDISVVRLEARSVLAKNQRLSARTLMSGYPTAIPAGAIFGLSVKSSSNGSCTTSRGGIKAVKGGTCTVIVTMRPRATAAYPRPRTVRATVIVTVAP